MGVGLTNRNRVHTLCVVQAFPLETDVTPFADSSFWTVGVFVKDQVNEHSDIKRKNLVCLVNAQRSGSWFTLGLAKIRSQECSSTNC